MPVINYITDETAVGKLTKNKAWLETYIPEVTARLSERGFDVVFDKEAGFDLTHIHMPLRLAHRLTKNCNGHCDFPVIYHGHATEDSFTIGSGMKYFVRKWFKKIAGKSDLIICPSRFAEEYYRKLLPEHDIYHLNYGINLEKYSFSREARTMFRERFSIGEDEMVVSCVGGISKRKGIDDFIKLATRHPDIRFMWVGGEYTSHIGIDIFYKLFARHGDVVLRDLPDNVLMTGYTKEIPAALSASDIFFFPSRQETQGLALVEAAACGLPILTRNIPVFLEWLTPGRDCLMGADEQEFDNCLRHMKEDAALLRRLGSEARNSAEKNHDIDKTSARLGEIYLELIG